jgi:excisionase family DNA binding protein
MKPDDFSALPCLLTKKQAAYMLQVSVTTLDLLRKTKGLRSVKIGELVRFDSADLREFINRRKSRRSPLDVSHLQKGI